MQRTGESAVQTITYAVTMLRCTDSETFAHKKDTKPPSQRRTLRSQVCPKISSADAIGGMYTVLKRLRVLPCWAGDRDVHYIQCGLLVVVELMHELCVCPGAH